MEPWKHETVNAGLEIARRENGLASLLIDDGDRASALVSANDLPVIMAKLYEACGLPSPVILERPGVTSPDAGPQQRGSVTAGRLRGKVLVGLYGILPEELEPAEARSLAALIAAHADAAEAEPDPAEVDALAEVINSGREVRLTAADVARKILLAGYVKAADHA